jgi:hypothetical protein
VTWLWIIAAILLTAGSLLVLFTVVSADLADAAPGAAEGRGGGQEELDYRRAA